MSLLMDALRRAEAEKKEAAKQRAAEEASHKDSNETRAGSPLEPSQKPNLKPAAESGPEQSSRHAEVSVEDDEDLGATVKLDRLPLPMVQHAGDEASSNSDSPVLPAVSDITKSLGDSLDGLSVDFDSTSPRMRSEQSQNDQPSDTGLSKDDPQDRSGTNAEKPYDFSIHANPDSREVNESLSLEPLSETIVPSTEPLPESIPSKTSTLPSARSPSLSANSDATLTANDADPLMISLPGETPLDTSSGQTAVSANTVFEAGSSGISRRIILWTLTLGIALFALLAVTGVYYFQQAPTARSMPSPIASVEIEKARSALEIERQKANLSASNTEGGDLTNTHEESTTSINLPPKDDSVIPEEQRPPQKVATNSSVLETKKPVENGTTQTGISAMPVDDEFLIKDIAPKGIPNVDTKRLKIAKSTRGVRANEQVIAAYRAYRSGDLGTAKILYEKALSIRPQDINALNGLAALALGDGKEQKAHQMYSKVLKLEPNNPTAAAALFQIEGGAGTRVTESQLKLMLDNGGDSGLINFALGNLYSRHGRWNDAQLAFFEALRYQPGNADYLYNLAVSLDQIGQRKPAVDYYRQALTAADDSHAGFNAADVIARIHVITQSASSSAP